MSITRFIPLFALIFFALILWFTPPPLAMSPNVWYLFTIFITTIAAILFNLLPIIAASIIALAVSVLAGVIEPAKAYAGFSESFILLIVAAFLVSHAVHKSGLGKRLSLHIIRRFGHSTLGLGYSVIATDILIAPAFPSNTARSGVLYPIIYGLAHDCGSKVGDNTHRRAGSYLMMTSMAGLTISSGLWLTAMAVNPIGVGIAETMGIHITFLSWLLYALLPTIIAFIAIPWVLFKIYPPELRDTPDAPQIAKDALSAMGRISRNEWITGSVFLGMLILWSLSGMFPIDKTAVAFGGLGILMATRVFGIEDFKAQGEALSTLIWFAILFALSTQLAEQGFMRAVAEHFTLYLSGLSWVSVYLLLIVIYVLIHYLFVSQSAHLLALFGIFLSIGVSAGVPGELMAMMLLFATNFNATITPQGSSCNAIYLSSGYIQPREIYLYGGAITLLNLMIFLIIGTPWILAIS
ncbi:DASS family sodium-coupled anion symporter [Sulfuricurvum sp. RIFCSPLOWO2_12_FULL_43_24]|uniref:DASS family sodium-coupled anion symporter n=1 Tax=Sulfuricurvum sp. RIFCSPLOWO2_12_FULL_43_24 TaxID=1802247 RepID=UPI0008CE6883|nr:DASS family sodium-coupled anion symporter [Sulfuricurvum sp. RIFCSPLOWO2_12_FULL_43_24]OHD84323.1 MAG: oxidoreductase [Sulfuricurvum sp. RIFCSPLOWO2_02_43_6]OHD90417.1 MAG: oxidoreductase [Sulfuricurvum sp. RIFCSPLOWO2_12_FULL_43_24]